MQRVLNHLVCRILVALLIQIVLNAPPKMALLWFSVDGRATADMVGTIGNVMGLGVGQVLSSVMTPPSTIPNATIVLNHSTSNFGNTTSFSTPSMEFMVL